ncbi:MAG: transglycosylase domain-containing protein [Patescibacteria group bacterium]|nr:transglycosylase domain-containing protein [Patescibacteria group bacterium]
MDTPKVPGGRGRNRRTKNTITTKSGNTLKINRSIADRSKAGKAARAAAKATYLSTLPKDRLKRILYRMHPKRVAKYWFSREGGIMALKMIGIGVVAVFFLTIGMFAYFRKDLPKIKDISGNKLGGSITYYDRTGQTVLFQDYDAIKRIPVPAGDISPFLKHATIAIEDKDFYKHGAFDVRGITRAALNDAKGGGTVQGGSTLTQQLVKLNEQWTDNRTVTRKVKELILAVELEREYSKDDVLTGYLNIAPYGGVQYGAESASRDYFQKSAKDLTLEQATMLAAIPQSPSYYSPYASAKYNEAVSSDTFSSAALLNRQHYILDQMVTQGYITRAQADTAKKVDVLAQVKKQTPKFQGIKAPYFVLSAKQQLQQQFGSTVVNRGGWKVITTLNLDLQAKAEDLVATNASRIARYGADEEAMVSEDVQTGEIVSLVGGTDFTNEDHGQNNYAGGIKIPPGSSFKPYDYTTLIDNNNNVGAGSVFYDTQGPLPGYPCTDKTTPTNKKISGNCLLDYDFKYPGPVTLRYGLGGSRNVPAVKAMLASVPNDKSPGNVKSVNKVIDTASAMMYNTYNDSRHKKSYNCYSDPGLTKTTQCYGASAIGDGAFLHLDDHVNGLSTLARMGKAIPRTYILKITDAAQKEVKIPKALPKQVIKADTAYIVNNMASDPKASYLPGSCTETSCTALGRGGYKFQRFNGWQFAVKTGTTNSNFDGLMTSWSSKYATVSWVGNHTRNVELKNVSMETLTEPITRGWMEYAHKDIKAENWVAPTTIKTAPAYIVRSHVGIGSIEPSPTNDLFPGHYVGGGSVKNTAQTIDRVSNKVATSCTPAAAKQVVGNANVASWNIDIFNGGRANVGSTGSSSAKSSASATDDVHNCSDSPPTITLTAPDTCETTCTITATVTQGTHPLSDPAHAEFPGKVSFTLNGQVIHSEDVTDSPSTISFTYNPTENGNGTLVAIVTDSVLYSGSQSSPINFTVPQKVDKLTLNSPSNNQAVGTTTTVSWSGGTGPYTVYVNGSASACQNTGATSCSVAIPSKGANTIYVKSNDEQSESVTVNRG